MPFEMAWATPVLHRRPESASIWQIEGLHFQGPRRAPIEIMGELIRKGILEYEL